MTKQTQIKRVRITTYRVGTNFGWSAAIKLRNGRTLEILDETRPTQESAQSAAESLVARLGYEVVS